MPHSLSVPGMHTFKVDRKALTGTGDVALAGCAENCPGYKAARYSKETLEQHVHIFANGSRTGVPAIDVLGKP
jgi:hypothetical protein